VRGIRFALLLLCAVSTGAMADQTLLATADHAMAVGDYRSAVQAYEQVLAQSGNSAPVLFNLGNAWVRLGKPGPAILAYERALVLAPHNPAIEANLAGARQHADLIEPAASSGVAIARYFSFDTYAWAALAAIWVLCGALVMLCLSGRARRIARPLILVSVLTLCASADAAVMCWPDLYRAVAQESATLHLAPAASAAASGAVREGEVVWLQGRYGAFELVRTADGHSGWAEDTVVVPIRVAPP
jgi:tetratricopeptide (TPR) repeat protein